MYDLIQDLFDIADRYRTPAVLLADAVLGQMMEPMTLREGPPAPPPPKPWATNGARGRRKNIVNSLYIDPVVLEQVNLRMAARYAEMAQRDQRSESTMVEDADLVIVAYGTAARVAGTAMELAREEGRRVGLFRPISLYPFPNDALAALTPAKGFLTFELSLGQMVDDVRLAIEGRSPVAFFGRTGGIVPTPQEVLEQIRTRVEAR
jgi:2-oxoglutarate ferredoxin oxidoreductase subunit alpha